MSRLTPLLFLIVLLDLRCIFPILATNTKLATQFSIAICISQETPTSSTGDPDEYIPPSNLGRPKRLEGGGAR